MSSPFGLFKRPRSESDKQVRPSRTVFGDFSSAYSSIAGRSINRPFAAPPDSAGNVEASGVTSREFLGPRNSPGLSVARDFFQPGRSGIHGHVPLWKSLSPPVSPHLPAGSQPVSPPEIGTKFPTLSYGSGVNRRVIHDPNSRSPLLPLENTVSETDRHAHRRSASMTDLTLRYPDHSSPLSCSRPADRSYSPNLPLDVFPTRDSFARRRHLGPQQSEQAHVESSRFCFPEPQAVEEQARAISNDIDSEDRVEDLLPPNISLQSREKNNQSCFEEHISEMGNLMMKEETSGNEAYEELDAYEQVGEYDYDVNAHFESDEEIEQDASSLYIIGSTPPRRPSGILSLEEYMWSPRGSLDAGSVFSADVEAQRHVHPSAFLGPVRPPSAPLPQMPSQGFHNIGRRAYRDVSTTTERHSHSSESYGNTRNLLRLPQSRITCGENSAQSFARVSVVDTECSVHSRSLSEAETHELEDDVRAHMQSIGETDMADDHIHNRDQYQHSHHHIGSLSISYLQTESQVGETGSSQRSSSFGVDMHAPREGLGTREAHSGRKGRLGFYDDGHSPSQVRSGPPPLLFGRRDLGSYDLDFPEPATSGVRSNDRLAQILAAAGSNSNSRLAQTVTEDEDGDWETETGSGAFSRQFVREATAQGETGSSYADNSDSGSLSQSKGVETSSTQHVVQHSPHARYSQNWTLLQDAESGKMVLAPRPQALSFAAATSPHYHHSSPLSKEHTHQFSSSPPLRHSAQVPPRFADLSRSEARSARSHQSGQREMFTNENFHEESPLSRAILSGFGTGTMYDGRRDETSSGSADEKGRPYPSYAWLNTMDGKELNTYNDVSCGGGSFAKVTALSAKANVTGTPERSESRQIQTSGSDASIPIVAGSPFVQHNSRTPNSSRDQDPHRKQFSPLNHPLPSHLLHLGEASSSRSVYPAKTPQRRSFDGRMDPSEGEASTAQLNRGLRKYPIGPDLLGYDDDDDNDEGLRLTKDKTNLSPEVRRHRQNLVEHSLLPPRPEPLATEQKRLSLPLELLTRGSSTMNNMPINTVGMRVGGSMPQFIPNSPGYQVRKRSPHRPPSGEISINVEHGNDPLVPAQEPSHKTSFAAVNEARQEKPQASHGYSGGLPYDSMYGDFLREMRGDLAYPVVRPPTSGQRYNRPIARAESPHLYRVPRLPIDKVHARQKKLSSAYLWGFMAVFPLLLLFGHGLLDKLIAWHTDGEVVTFRHEEKMVALWVGYGSFAAVLAGLCVVLAFLL
ncbi:hypothetical protein MMC07_003083 [Pseudocyphellaria aurata]|nr:hypothetical protein [Pseudocyphellaria aurata]